jgi:hypothetical protein
MYAARCPPVRLQETITATAVSASFLRVGGLSICGTSPIAELRTRLLKLGHDPSSIIEIRSTAGDLLHSLRLDGVEEPPL